MKLFNTAIVLALLSTLTACGGESTSSSDRSANYNHEYSGRLVVGGEKDYGINVYHDSYGNVKGMDVDIINEIAKINNLEVVYNLGNWEGVYNKLKSGKIDVAISGIQIDDTNRNLLHTKAYWQDGFVILSKASNYDISLENDRIGYQSGITYIKNGREYKTSYLAFESMMQGKLDAVIVSNSVASYLINQYADFKFNTRNYTEKTNVTFIASNEQTQKMLNNGIEILQKNGKLQDIRNKYGLF